MKTIKNLVVVLILISDLFSGTYAQSYNKPLTFQAFNHTINSSAVSRSMGGLTFIQQSDLSLMFLNPASLQNLEGIQFTVGAAQEFKRDEQSQRWYSLDMAAMFGLFMEGKTAGLPDPVMNLPAGTVPTYRDSIQRNGRDPNWSNKKNQFIPAQFLVSIPLKAFGTNITVGAGVHEYANTNYFYMNNTSLSRDVSTITVPLQSSNVLVRVNLWGDSRSREGSLYGYGSAVSVKLTDELTAGVSGEYISGKIDDTQIKNGFGLLEFFNRDFRYTSKPYTIVTTGSSDVKGFNLTISGSYSTRNVILGISITPPKNFTRDFTTTSDSTRGTVKVSLPGEKGSDKTTYPWCGTIGGGFKLRSNVFLGVEYEYKPYSLVEYSDSKNKITKPWMDCSSFHLGLEYKPVEAIAVRFGYQTANEIFQQEGNALQGDPVKYSIYSIGFGINLISDLTLNLGCEYLNIHYEDNWGTNTNINKEFRNTVFGSITYAIK